MKKEAINPFKHIEGMFYDDDAMRSDGTIWCKIHKEAYKAIPTGNFCLKKYKNCPKCEVEINYRIAKKEFRDGIYLNKMLMEVGKPMLATPIMPDKPEWWDVNDNWHYGDSKKNNSSFEVVSFDMDDNPF